MVVDPLFIDSDEVVDWLYENDPGLLRGVVSHNEQMERLCT